MRDSRLRWPVPPDLGRRLVGRRVVAVERRAKYLLLRLDRGHVILHLGMSGHLSVVPAGRPAAPHDHVDLLFGRRCLRLRDPRRFGAVLWCAGDPLGHPRLCHLGPEPLADGFDGAALHQATDGRRAAIKSLLLDGRVVAGVGNIYANEALFRAGIHPARAGGRISRARYDRLAAAIREVLEEAIERGGTTLRDYRREDGRPGGFALRLRVYGRAGEPCPACGRALLAMRQGQRATVYCGRCQR